jgi:hypothetical protein
MEVPRHFLTCQRLEVLLRAKMAGISGFLGDYAHKSTGCDWITLTADLGACAKLPVSAPKYSRFRPEP